MLPKDKEYFRKILTDFMNSYRVNPELSPFLEGVPEETTYASNRMDVRIFMRERGRARKN